MLGQKAGASCCRNETILDRGVVAIQLGDPRTVVVTIDTERYQLPRRDRGVCVWRARAAGFDPLGDEQVQQVVALVVTTRRVGIPTLSGSEQRVWIGHLCRVANNLRQNRYHLSNTGALRFGIVLPDRGGYTHPVG